MIRRSDNLAVVAYGLTRRVVGSLAVLGVLGLALLPPEHFHASRDHDSRHADVVHRHLAPHHLFEPHGTNAGVDHTDDDAQYLSAAFVGPKSAPRIDPIQSYVTGSLLSTRPAQTLRPALPSPDVRVHDPPWCASLGLRGPPALLV
jgi:hypothetical protein